MLLLALFVLVSMNVTAQQKAKFRVVSFAENSTDLSARMPDYEQYDGNGDRFAIIKVKADRGDDELTAYQFNFGQMECQVMPKDNELWLYVQRGAKHVSILRAGYNPVSKFDLGVTIQPGSVYEMILSAESPKVSKQMVLFKITPADAKAVVMYKSDTPGATETMLGTTDFEGSLVKTLPLGRYFYKIISDNYHTSEGVVTLGNSAEMHTESVTLRPNFSKITLTAGEGVEIYIEGVKRGTTSWTGTLNAGTYNVECRKAGHKSASTSITVNEGDMSTIELPAPTPVTGVLAMITSPLGASITIDGVDYGTTPRSINDLLVGEHTVLLTKDGYAPAEVVVMIYDGETTEQNVTLERGSADNVSVSSNVASQTKASNASKKSSKSNNKKVNLKGRNTITGIVVDKNGNPLADVEVAPVGSQTTVFTKDNGEFSIDVLATNKKLSFALKKFETKKIKTQKLIGEDNLIKMNKATPWTVTAVAAYNIEGDIFAGIMAGYLGNWGGYFKLAGGTGALFTIGVTKRIISPLHFYFGVGAGVDSSSCEVYAADLGFVIKPTRNLNINLGVMMGGGISSEVFAPQLGIGFSF